MRLFLVLFLTILHCNAAQFGPQPCAKYGMTTGYFEHINSQFLGLRTPDSEAEVIAKAFQQEALYDSANFEIPGLCRFLKSQKVKTFYFACFSDSDTNDDRSTNCSVQGNLCFSEYVEARCFLAVFPKYYDGKNATWSDLQEHRLGFACPSERLLINGEITSRYKAIADQTVRQNLYSRCLRGLLLETASPNMTAWFIDGSKSDLEP